MTEEQIYAAALAHYGIESQRDKLIEEMAELTQALMKFKRKPNVETNKHVHEEFADVIIVMHQVLLTLDESWVKEFKAKKLNYLQDLIAQGNNDPNKY